MPNSSAAVVSPRRLAFSMMALAWSLLVWRLGPRLAFGEWHPLETEEARWLTLAGGGVTAVLTIAAFRLWRVRRSNVRLVAALASPQALSEGEELQLHKTAQQSFRRALKTLLELRFSGGRSGGVGIWTELGARITGRYLYERPWYLIIGAPGSGKTVALVNSGLRFPLAGPGAPPVHRGIGGTRHFDWWFADRAVLIDTAGRFTTQDSSTAQDRAGWLSLLALLKKSRSRKPLNGVLVTVSVLELFGRIGAGGVSPSQTLRARIQDLCQQLSQRLPIYLLITKCDLIGGFTETFADLGATQRTAPWGFTFSTQPRSFQDAFATQFDTLLERLNQGLIQRLQAEIDPASRVRIYCFPNEFANLRTNLWSLVQDAFSSWPIEIEPMLRGIYFVSATQEGMPIDRVLDAVARHYHLEQALQPQLPTGGRSYFLQHLFTEVVFADKGATVEIAPRGAADI